jgi:membrane-bound serine protease (ClpP class)
MIDIRFLLLAIPALIAFPVRGEDAPVADSQPPISEEEIVVPADDGTVKIFVIPIEGQIGKPTLYVVRRGVKEAIEADAKIIVLDVDTPGGDLATTLEIMQILDRYEGLSVTFVNSDAISAGAFISAATSEIRFAPDGVIGAAAPVMATGQEIDETMQLKIESYLKAKIRSISEDYPMRAEVISAMVDADYELKIGDEVLKPKGELLSLTASEAMKEYGDPPLPLLGAGISDTLEELIDDLAGGQAFERRDFEITWSIELARWLTVMSPLFLGLGTLLLFVEFKTPGFGVFGVVGLLLVGIVFFGHHVAGLSGNEAFLIFILGFLLVMVEILIFPGLIFPAALGAILMLGSLIWGMTDVWPSQSFEFSWDLLTTPLFNLTTGFAITVVLAFLLARFLPKSMFWDRLVLAAEVSGSASGIEAAQPPKGGPPPGTIVTAVTDLFPSGQIEYEGRRFDARLAVGTVEGGSTVRILRFADFAYIVEVAEK